VSVVSECDAHIQRSFKHQTLTLASVPEALLAQALSNSRVVASIMDFLGVIENSLLIVTALEGSPAILGGDTLTLLDPGRERLGAGRQDVEDWPQDHVD
jgi:hypothetical protein